MSRKLGAFAVLACAVLAFVLVRSVTKVPEPKATRTVEPTQSAAEAARRSALPMPAADRPHAPTPGALIAAAGPPPDPPDQPERLIPNEEGGLTEESARIWRDEKSTALDIDRANMLDVCACHDPQCVRSLQTRYFERKQRAPLGSPNPDEDDSVRQKRTECMLAISTAAYEQKLASAAASGAR